MESEQSYNAVGLPAEQSMMAMDPQGCTQAIASHTPFDPTEAESIAATMAFLEGQPRFWHSYYFGPAGY